MARKPNGYWTLDNCRKEAKKYETASEFASGSRTAYNAAHRKGFLKDISSHFSSKQKPRGYWTKDRCAEEAMKYQTRTKFKEGSPKAYDAARTKGFLPEICAHMVRNVHEHGYWTKERCLDEALKYSTRKEFSQACKSAYQSANNNDWLDEACEHMAIQEHGRFHCSYVILNEGLKLTYVGITRDKFERRMNAHRSDNNTTKSKHISKRHDSQFIQTSGYIYSSEDIAKNGIEANLAIEYSKLGYEILNNASYFGALGTAHLYWTKVRCKKEALRYNTRSDFIRNSHGAYASSARNDWLDEVCCHMTSPTKPNGYWTKDRCKEEALKYKTKAEFRRNSPSAHAIAKDKGFMEDICSHMVSPVRPRGYWTIDRCSEEARKYKSRSLFQRGCATAYKKARVKGWLDEVCSHMNKSTKKAA